MLIDIIAGARPNFIKIAPLIASIKRSQQEGKDIKFRLIHTGQHYDKNMSDSFFEQLNIPYPDVNLEVGSGTQAEQTAGIMVGYERVLLDKMSDLCVVVGDVTSTMACSIAAKKLHVRVAHIEAGIRSNDLRMPEEINRMLTDSITDYFFTTTTAAGKNLERLGTSKEQIYFVGNIMIDTLRAKESEFRAPEIWKERSLKEKDYFVLTLHRPSNVDAELALEKTINEICSSAKPHPVIFPVHPRTRKILDKLDLNESNLFYTEPLSYLEFNHLVKYAKGVITDSGGITEETTVMGIPCVTLRENTERPETCEIGTNELIGTSTELIASSVEKIKSNQWKKGSIPELWDGNTADRIVKIILELLK